MSDFFIGQILVFAALLPALLRPYIAALRSLEGVPLLSVVAAAVCAGTAAAGIRVLFFPLFAFTLVVLAFQAPAIVSMFRRHQHGLPEERPNGISAALLAVFAALVAVCGYFQPEFSCSPKNEARATTKRPALSAGFRYSFHVFEPEEAAGALSSGGPAAILYFPSFPAGKSGRDTFLSMAADRGFEAIAVHWSGKNLYPSFSMNNETLRDLTQIVHAIGQSFQHEGAEAHYVTRFARAQEGVMQTVIIDAARFAHERVPQNEGETPPRLFAVAEGYACTSLAAVVASRPDLFAGAAYLLSEDDAMNLNVDGAESYSPRSLDSPIPNSAAEFPQIIITDGREGALGFGEMAADDPALAALLNVERDSGRRLARLAAVRVLYWIEARYSLLDRQPARGGNSVNKH